MKSIIILVSLLAVAVSVSVEDGDDKLDFQKDAGLGDFVNQVFWKKCSQEMTTTCFKIRLIKLIDRLSHDSTFEVSPGVYITSNLSKTSQVYPELVNSTQRSDATLQSMLDLFLYKRIDSYLKSLSLNFKLLDTNDSTQKSLEDVLSKFGTARKKGGAGGNMLGIGMMMGGSMLAMGLAALAALAGKALMTALLALILSALSAMKGGGGGGSTHYEVISRPEVSHAHTHSSEVQYGHHGHGYKRSIDTGFATHPIILDLPGFKNGLH